MRRDKTELMLHEPNLYKAFMLLALPVFGANFLKAFHELVDTFFVGQTANSVAAQAALSVVWPLLNIFTSFQIGFGVAGVAVISQLLGAERKEDARKNAGMLLVISIVLGLIVNLLLYLTAPAVMGFMGAQGQVLEFSVGYLRVRSFEMVFTFLFAAFQAVRQAQGDTITPVVLSVVAAGVNIVLTWLFVWKLDQGVLGAGVATVLGNLVVAPVCVALLFSKRQELALNRRAMRVHWPIMLHLTRVATPAAASQAFSALGFLVLQAVILSYGDAVMAAFSIGNKICNILLMPVMALGTVLAAYVGQNIGAGNPERAKQAYLVSRNTGLLLTVVGALLLFVLREQTIALLTNDSATQNYAMEYIFWVLITQPLMSLFQNYLGVFNGSGHTSYAFLMSTLRLWAIRLPLILFFRQCTQVGRVGIWMAMVISNFVISVIGALLFRRVDFAPLHLVGESDTEG